MTRYLKLTQRFGETLLSMSSTIKLETPVILPQTMETKWVLCSHTSTNQYFLFAPWTAYRVDKLRVTPAKVKI